jgi:hypothetical protein
MRGKAKFSKSDFAFFVVRPVFTYAMCLATGIYWQAVFTGIAELYYAN